MLDPRNLSLTNRGLKVTTEESTSLIYILNWPGIASNGSFNKILKGYFQLLSFNLISNEFNFFWNQNCLHLVIRQWKRIIFISGLFWSVFCLPDSRRSMVSTVTLEPEVTEIRPDSEVEDSADTPAATQVLISPIDLLNVRKW